MLQAAKYIGAGLATIGLTKDVLSPVLSPRLLCPSVITDTAKVAIIAVDKMLKSLPEDSLVLNHIKQVASNSESMLHVSAEAQGDLVIPSNVLEFPDGNIPNSPETSGAGVYVFTDKEVAPDQTERCQAVGSAINFGRRLDQHKDS